MTHASVRCVVGIAVVSAMQVACAHPKRLTARSSRSLARAVGRADEARVMEHLVPSARATVDFGRLLEQPQAEQKWKDALAKPIEVEPRAVLQLRADYPVDVILTADGWRFAEDPTAIYAQDTPRHALRALVWASRAQRWDVVLRLAPRRYRIGLSEHELGRAWTHGAYGKVLRGARDVLAAHLQDPIAADADEARLNIRQGHWVNLEREGDQWVIVNFLPELTGELATVRGASHATSD